MSRVFKEGTRPWEAPIPGGELGLAFNPAVLLTCSSSSCVALSKDSPVPLALRLAHQKSLLLSAPSELCNF